MHTSKSVMNLVEGQYHSSEYKDADENIVVLSVYKGIDGKLNADFRYSSEVLATSEEVSESYQA